MRLIRALWLTVLLAAAPSPAAAELADIVSRGSVRIGVCLGFEPMGFRDSDNQPRGYDVDMAGFAAEALGLTLDLVPVNPPSVRAQLAAGDFDFAACGMTVTPRRARDLDFSLPYLRTGLKLLVPRQSPLTGLGDLGAGSTVVAMRDTTGVALVAAHVPEALMRYAGNSGDAVLMLLQGQADAYVEDAVTVDHLASRYADDLVALPQVYSSDAIGLLLSKGQPDLLRWLDIFVSTYVSSGAYAQSYRKWWHAEPPPISAPW